MSRKPSARNAFVIACSLLLIVSVLFLSVFFLSTPATAADKKDKVQSRLLLGKVLDQQDNPLVNAIVYVSDMRTHAVKTYIVGPDGTYRFPGLAMTDYEVYADYKGHKSDTKSVSQFDERSQVYIDLKIDTH
ncbi:MAG: carboxypeptidase-like regulatory domain-containing protein [Candidatus Sulfotelmatobacter sp.]